jgi:hypothetical protein
MNIESRIKKIEKALPPDKDPRYVDIWSLPEDQRGELSNWALGKTEKRPDFWPAEECIMELKERGYSMDTRDELRERFKSYIKLQQLMETAGTVICEGD